MDRNSIKGFKSLYVILCLLFFHGAAHAQPQAWQYVGNSNFAPSGYGGDAGFVIDGNGTPYVLYITASQPWGGGPFICTVYKYDGLNWVTVGGVNFINTGRASLAIDGNGTPYVGYSDAGNGGQATVVKYDGTNWVTIGNPDFAPRFNCLAVDPNNGTPYMLYGDPNNNNKLIVMKYNGTAWVIVGNADFSTNNATYNPSLTIDASGTPYVAYIDYAFTYRAQVMKYNSGTNTWVQVGPAGGFSTGGQIGNLSIALNNSGIPYVAFCDVFNNNKATVMAFDGTNWNVVGSAGFSAGSISSTSISFDNSGAPCVAYSDVANNYYATVMKYNGSNWVTVGNAGFNNMNSSGVILAIHNGVPFVAFNGYANAGTSVMRYTNLFFATGLVNGNTYCAGATVSIPYATGADLNAGNVFTAQLSDASGSFANPVDIGTLTADTTGVINATIPTGTASGTGYRIRIISSAPADTATDNGSDIVINAIVSPSVSIAAAPGDTICNGTPVTFTANTINGGTMPAYQWIKNGVIVGGNSDTYSDNTLNNNDKLICALTSNMACAAVTTVADTTVMTVIPTVVPVVSISANTGDTICAGTSVDFTAAPVNGGNAPTYLWAKNGNTVGSNNAAYTDNGLNNNDIITCTLISSAVCAVPDTVSDTVAMTVNPLLTPAVSISAAPGDTICTGTPVTFTRYSVEVEHVIPL